MERQPRPALEVERKLFLKLGFNYKNKSRDYKATRFYYNLNKINPTVTDIYDTDGFLNQENIADGNVTVNA